MADPISLVALTLFVAQNAPSWLASLRGTLLDKGREVAIDKGKEYATARGGQLVRDLFHLDEKEQLRHLQQALKNATERGLATFDTLAQRDQYKDILRTLSQPGPQGETLRQEIMHLMTFSDTPDLAALSDTYNRRQRFSNAAHQDIDVAPYLSSFFTALLAELYADPYFRQQLSDVLQLRAATSMQRSLLDIVTMLKGLGETLADSDTYTAQDLAHDIEVYAVHIERTLHNLKIVGVVPKDQNSDPELSGIFVPLRIALNEQTTYVQATLNEQTTHENEPKEALVAALEQYPCLVLLGGPGSGKSTATKYLAWRHAYANQATFALAHPTVDQSIPALAHASTDQPMPTLMLPSANQATPALAHSPLLSGNPLPLRIELRRLSEERKRANYDFLSFVVQVLLKRDGVEIDPQMFKELLARRAMLLLFDGLDEVATLDERRGLVEEIEHFALAYPGNRILVTSRPVGYELTRISHPLFAHAEVQNFNDAQIQRFLKNWYTAVLKLSPIPQREQEEIDLLLTTLQANPRLHKLAETPLLLTVITALHRYERLPDRRVLVYDRCADLLLETWARLRGTNARWDDLRLSREDQYTCVAFLGFVLHQRSQEEAPTNKGETVSTTVDVPARFLRKNVEKFLKERDLIIGVAEQHKVASRFIELVQEEAGLIVERGTAENGETLYSFVHRTFQEYFAAADIYERYQQQEDPTIISEFLVEQLHDPHWREVIFLLLGKLKSTPVTNQLRQILLGKIKSRRSVYTDIVQQDLFFICDCLLEEIKVDNTLVALVKSRLSNVVKSSPFPELRREALAYLGKLLQTRLYIDQGRQELFVLATDNSLDDLTRLDAAQVLYLYNPALSEERQRAKQILTTLLTKTNLALEQVWQRAEHLYRYEKRLETRQLALLMLSILLTRSDLIVEQVGRTANFLALNGEEGSEARQLAILMLSTLLRRSDLTIEQVREVAESLYACSEGGSEAQQQATSTLSELLKRADLTVEQIRETAVALYACSERGSEANQRAISEWSALLKRPDLTVEQVRETADFLDRSEAGGYRGEVGGSETRQQMVSVLSALLKRSDLTVEQTRKIAETLYSCSERGSEGRKLATLVLSTLLKRPDLTVEQVRATAMSLYSRSEEGSESDQLALSMLSTLLKRPGLTAEQTWQTAESLYRSSDGGSETRRQAAEMLSILFKRPGLTVEQMWQTAEFIYKRSKEGSEVRQLAIEMLSTLLKRPDLTVEQVRDMATLLYRRSEEGSEARQQALEILRALFKRPDLTVEQVRETAESLYRSSAEGREARQLATDMLITLLKRPDLTVEQMRETAESLYRRSAEGSEAKQLATSMLLTLLSHPDNSKNIKDVYDMLHAMVPQFHKIPIM